MKGTNPMKHDLRILSLNDGKASCNCGFYFVATGETTREEIKKLHDSLLTRKELTQ